jgi:hypothetical protein
MVIAVLPQIVEHYITSISEFFQADFTHKLVRACFGELIFQWRIWCGRVCGRNLVKMPF